MRGCNPALPMRSESNSNKQDWYAKTRLVHALELQITNLIPEVLSNLAISSLRHSAWLEEEQVQIRKIVTVLGNIHELRQQLETLSQPLINIYSKLSSSPPTSEQNPMRISGGVAHTSRQESAAPGRLSSSQTSWGTGLNFQNIPEQAKGMFVAPPGWEFSLLRHEPDRGSYRCLLGRHTQVEATVRRWLVCILVRMMHIVHWRRRCSRCRTTGTQERQRRRWLTYDTIRCQTMSAWSQLPDGP